MVRLRTAENIAAILALVLVALIVTVAVYMFSTHTVQKSGGSAESYARESKCYARIVAVKPKIGWVDVDIYSTCRARVDTVYFIDPITGDVIVPVQLVYPVELKPYSIVRLSIPLLGLGEQLEKLNRPVALALGTSSGWSLVTANWMNPYQPLKKALQNSWMVLLADRHRDRWDRDGVAYNWPHTHWVLFNFITGEYYFYSYTGRPVNPAKGPYHGYAPVLRDTNKYLVTCEWVSWSNRPIDSPVVIVYNPTKGLKEWRFVWIEPHGYDVFILPPVARDPSQVVYDFLVFWEDLWNPFSPPGAVDDWKDHVVRVTLYTSGVVRLQVYIAKGGYLHVFKHVSSLADADILGYKLCPESTVCPDFCKTGPTELYDYCKPHNDFWADKVSDGSVYVPECGVSKTIYYYRPMSDKVWYVRLTG